MSINKLVTIAIPFYNSEKYLTYAIQSVINQTYQNWELLLINDGSQDGSMSIALEFASHDARIRIVSDGENKGLAIRLNESIAMAKGEIYARMDDDDIMACDRIEEQVRYLENHPEVDVVGSSAIVIDGDNNIKLSIDQSGFTNGFLHPTVTGRTSWFQENMYDVRYRRCQDFELWMRTAKKSKFYNMQKPLLFYREVGSLSLKKSLVSHKTLRRLYREYERYGKTLGWCVKNILFSYFKDMICVFISIFTDSNMLRNKRRKQLPQAMMLSQKDIKRALGGVNLLCSIGVILHQVIYFNGVMFLHLLE